jgi:seryl-tRNA synthetase
MEQDQREELIRVGQSLKEELADFEDRLRQLENALQFEAQRLPNLTHPGAAIGGEENAILLKEIGSKISPDFEVCCSVADLTTTSA